MFGRYTTGPNAAPRYPTICPAEQAHAEQACTRLEARVAWCGERRARAPALRGDAVFMGADTGGARDECGQRGPLERDAHLAPSERRAARRGSQWASACEPGRPGDPAP